MCKDSTKLWVHPSSLHRSKQPPSACFFRHPFPTSWVDADRGEHIPLHKWGFKCTCINESKWVDIHQSNIVPPLVPSCNISICACADNFYQHGVAHQPRLCSCLYHSAPILPNFEPHYPFFALTRRLWSGDPRFQAFAPMDELQERW